MPEPNSPFYPPRAPWYAPAREVGHTVLATTRIRRIPTPGDIGLLQLLRGLLIPGQAFAIHQRPVIGHALTVVHLVLFVLGLAFLGQSPANVFFGLAISIHATSVLHLIAPWLRTSSVALRLASCAAAIAGVIIFVYLPLQGLTSLFLFKPIQAGEEIVVVRPTRNPAHIQRGDWVVYRSEFSNSGSVVFHSGLGLGPVYAFAGETVEFGQGFVRVAGKSLPAAPGMPTSGSVSVPENCWFIWPHLRTLRSVGISADVIQAAIANQAIVDRQNFRGRPFSHWFHRPQILAAP